LIRSPATARAGDRAAGAHVTLADEFLDLVQRGAREHPNAKVRRECLTVLDHQANDEAGDVFRAALSDPVPRVR
jgi:hypothetical protein